MKLLVIGHGRHGKDTVCEILRDYHGMNFISSSRFVCEEAIWPGICDHTHYRGIEECYADRHNHRQWWAEQISAYNTPDKTRTSAGMLDRGMDIYCGMRMRDELEAVKAARLFDHVIWVDRSNERTLEDPSSMQLIEEDADYVLDNNSDLYSLWHAVDRMMDELEGERWD